MPEFFFDGQKARARPLANEARGLRVRPRASVTAATTMVWTAVSAGVFDVEAVATASKIRDLRARDPSRTSSKNC
jgi:hypothetical protein